MLPLLPVTLLLIALLASSIKIASEHERAVIFRLGRLVPQPKGPGLFLVIPLIDRMIRVDLTKQTLADAIRAHEFVGDQVIIQNDNFVLLRGMPWPARSKNDSPLVTGQRACVEQVEDDLRLVVGSVPPPTQEEPS